MSDEHVTITLLKSERDELKEAIDFLRRLDVAIIQRYVENRTMDMAILSDERDRQYKKITDMVRVIMDGQV